MNKFYATVTVPVGRCFPIDMFRYDQCWPLDESGSQRIGVQHYEDGSQEEEQIHVCKWHDNDPADWQKGVWSVERWKSKFGVKCTPLDGIPF